MVPCTSLMESPTMGLMLNLTIPIEGFMALRNAVGEERAVALARALERAQIKGEADLAAKLQQDWRNEMAAMIAPFARREEMAAMIAPFARREELAEIRNQIAQLPTREEFKRFATHEDLAELRTQFMRLDKKMTVGFLTLLGLNLASSAPTFLEWGVKVVGYALK